jgi:KDO2-lipid IV(A) lauroyltransferase
MDAKKIRKNIGYFFGWLALNLCSLIINILPAGYIYPFSRGLAFIGHKLAGKQRKIALEGLTTAFGKDKSAPEIEGIARECFTNIAKSAIELIFLMEHPKLLRERVAIEGKENLENALSAGKGVIIVSAHFGNFPLMLGKLCLEGYKVAGIMRHMRDPRAEKFFKDKRDKFGMKTVYTQPRKECVENSIRILRNNELLFTLLDQNFGTAGVFVDFFGRKAATATGPVVFAQRTGAALIPCFMVRQVDDTHKIIFERALELEKGNTEEETIIMNIQKLTNVIESYIRKYPAEWGWIHRRWKSKPSE